jgi:lysozyme
MISEVITQLRNDEGWRDRPYRDTLGFLTTGYGFLIDERKSVSMPKAVGELWLKLIVEDKWAELTRREPWVLEQPEDVQQALANMAYQLGINGLLNFKNMLGALRAGQRVSAAAHALDSAWAKQTPQRAERTAALIRGV